MRRTKFILISVFGLFLVGCVNPYEKFYVDRTGGSGIPNSAVMNIGEEPKLIQGTNTDGDTQRMLEDGFRLIGYSDFNAGNTSIDGAIEQAKNVHAAVVIYYSKYRNTVSGAMPLTLPNTETTTTNVYGNTYGSSGYNSFSGTANSTTYGTRTTYIPYNVNRYDYFASYWVKSKPGVLGVIIKNMTDEQRKEVGGNKGVAIQTVVVNSPAYRADFLKGDILRTFANTDLYDYRDAVELIKQHAGEKVDITYMRDGKEFTKSVQLGGLQP